MKYPNSQSNLEKEEQSWEFHTSWLQIILQSYGNQTYGTETKMET